MGGPFSLRCLSPLCSPAAGAGQTQPVPLGMVRRSLDIFAMQKASVGSNPRWLFYASRRACRPTAVFSTQLTRKLHQTREPWHPLCHGDKSPANPHVLLHPCAAPPRSSGSRGTAPCASRGTCRATAVKSQPIRMSSYTPARLRRAVRGQGALPLARAVAPVVPRR